MKIQVIIILAVVAAVAAQQNLPSPQTTKYYCGPSLSKALATLCYKDFMQGEKRGDYDELNTYPAIIKSWLAETQALALFRGRGKRQQQMVISECCDKPCAIEELMTYCST